MWKQEPYLWLFLNETPTAKGRPRFSKFGTYTPSKTKHAEDLIKYKVMAQMAADDKPKLNKPIAVRLVLRFVYPGKIRALFPVAKTTRPDVDNLVKLVLDALNGVVWEDDAQVAEIQCTKLISSTDGAIGTFISVYEQEEAKGE